MDLRSQLADFEGRRKTAYRDTLGVLTIGIGHTGPEVHEGLVWTDEQIDAAFDADVIEATDGIKAALPWFDQLNEPRKAVLIGMAFQMGVAGLLQFRRTLGSVRDERFADAANGMMNSVWASQTPRRARILAAQMSSGAWES